MKKKRITFFEKNKPLKKQSISSNRIFWGTGTIVAGLGFIFIFILDICGDNSIHSDIYLIDDLIFYIFGKYSWIFYFISGIVIIIFGYLDIRKYYKYKNKKK